jgi:hypothetical protein
MRALRERRLKIARLAEMNDPFEMLPFDMSNRDQRIAALMTLDRLNGTAAVLCFSKSWTNPVVWSHYADQHRGVCLGFDIADDMTKPIAYAARREPLPDFSVMEEQHKLDTVDRMLYTKFEDWHYENEVRVHVRLDCKTAENGLFFADWGEHLRLNEVVVGMRSATCKRELEEALSGYTHPVTLIRARASRTSFSVETDPDGVLNHDEVTYYMWRGKTRHPVEFVV